MARRGSAITDASFLSDDTVDSNNFYHNVSATPSIDNPTIAPWLDEKSSHSGHKSSRTFGFPSKVSLTSFLSSRQGSTTSLLQRHYGRTSESQSTLNISEGKRRSTEDNDSSRGLTHSSSSTGSADMRKRKSSLRLLTKLRNRNSKSQIRPGSPDDDDHPSLRPPAPPLPEPTYALLNASASPSTLPLSAPIYPKERREKKKKSITTPPLSDLKDLAEHHYTLDTNLEQMDGIIDLRIAPHNHGRDSDSPTSAFGSSTTSHSFSNTFHSAHSLSSADFSNPFAVPMPSERRRSMLSIPYEDHRGGPSPKTSISIPGTPGHNYKAPIHSPLLQNALPGSPTWVPPESWAVEKDEEDLVDGDYTSSEESAANGHTHAVKVKAPSGMDKSSPVSPDTTPQDVCAPKKKRKTTKPQRLSVPSKPYRIRIYRANNTYHVVSIPFSVTVANLAPALNKKLLLGDDRVQHRLYLKERGRERILAQTERPADIVRRRLEQAGYDPMDGLELLGGEGLSFLLRFVYKSQLLGPAEEDLRFENFEYIDLTGRGLRTIPVILHQHADSIISLRLSRNPMIEIPLDFIQSCTALRELQLSNMAMKKVPQSVRHSSTLYSLDLSSNRISDLEEAYLEDIPGLMSLFVQNNRIERLPWNFPRLRSLVTLNISNNKFRNFPNIITKLETLQDLDISFNMISELPEDIGRLTALERLVIVGNQVSKFPDECRSLLNLRHLDCRRNQISNLTIICMLPNIHHVKADYNSVHALDLSLGPNLAHLDVCHNDITQLSLIPGPVGMSPYALTSLDLSYAKLSSLDHFAIGQLSSLRTLKLDHNAFRYLPDTLGELSWLETLSCSDNKLDTLPSTIGQLQKLEVLDAHNNCLTELPQSLWHCASLMTINVTSNFLGVWHDPPVNPVQEVLEQLDDTTDDEFLSPAIDRKTSTTSLGNYRSLPPLVHSLEKLYLGENRLTDLVIRPLMIFKELRVLNLSFNEIQDLPSSFFRNMIELEELYLSGNKLTSIPTEDLPRLKRLSTLFLNGNKLQTLPQELGKVKGLAVLDVGSNLLKYNINNWEFDWNWNFNKSLRYLNLSGNKRLQIKSDIPRHPNNSRISKEITSKGKQSLSGFTDLIQLRVLGLMDVTITTTGMGTTVDIPDENEDRRVRTSLSTVNGMAYGISDALGRHDHLNMLDLVHEFIGRKGEAIFAMFGRVQPPKALPVGASPNRLAKFLHDNYVQVFSAQLEALNPNQGEGVPDAIRRTFLKLNQDLHDALFSNARKMSTVSATGASNSMAVDYATLRSGASGIVIYFKQRTMYVANVGNALAVVSRQGIAQSVSRKHDPYDRSETARIRSAEGWISPPGLVNDEVDVSRSFGFFHHLPVINARPDVYVHELTSLDEFVIVANRGLWDYVTYQTAVDIANSVAHNDRPDPMIAAQKLRDFAISYGADGSTMIMVIWVADLFEAPGRLRQPTLDSIVDSQLYRTKKKDDVWDNSVSRLKDEVNAPIGHLALVFTDIRNSTHLWEANPGMPTAMRLHNVLLRRQLRFCGGYEVKTEGDAFMCSFPNALSAVWWCLTVQNQLLHEPWPLEILECEDGKPIEDSEGRLIARGLSVRMGVHCGSPVCEPDPITHRMDYFGPMVNRASRISGNAAGGQIMCSADIIREINAKVLETEPETEYSKLQSAQAIDAIRRMNIVVVPVGEVKLKGLELPEILSVIYPSGLEGRQNLKEDSIGHSVSGSRVQFNIEQLRRLGIVCLRLEYLVSGRIFRPLPDRKGSIQTVSGENEGEEQRISLFTYGDPSHLLPPMHDQLADSEIMFVLDSLSTRIQNAVSTLLHRSTLKSPTVNTDVLLAALKRDGVLDERTLKHIVDVLHTLES